MTAGGTPESPDEDPLAWLVLDEEFIAAAERAEPSAAERERARRQESLRHRLADPETLQADLEHIGRKYAPTVTDPARRPRRHKVRRLLMAAALLAGAGVWAWEWNRSNNSGEYLGSELEGIDADGRPTDWPSRAEDTRSEPLGGPPTVQGSGAHGFVQLQSDGVTPVAYDPCRVTHYVTRAGGPPEGAQLIREAIAAVSAATGLVFVDDGTTDEAPLDDRPPFDLGRYGDRWAPVLIAWSDPVESPRLGTVDPENPLVDVAGFAGSTAVGPGTSIGEEPKLVYVSGSVTLDGPDLEEILTRPDGWATARSIVLHELGHLVGLDHVDDPSQLMAAAVHPGITEFGAGDLQGLAALGRGACFPEV